MAIIRRRLRGIRAPIHSGTVLGRVDPGLGDVHEIPLGEIPYDNTSSGLDAETFQDAIDELVADLAAIATAGAFLPLVTGDVPGPVAIATGDGQFIAVPVS